MLRASDLSPCFPEEGGRSLSLSLPSVSSCVSHKELRIRVTDICAETGRVESRPPEHRHRGGGRKREIIIIKHSNKILKKNTDCEEMEEQTQSSLITSSKGTDGTVDPSPGAVAKETSGVSLVKDLIYWHDLKKTGVVFGSMLTLLVSLAVFSVVSVLAYLVLALLSVTISFRIYRSVVQAVQKTNDGNPFKAYLELDITLSAETFGKHCDIILARVNRALRHLIRLFLVHDLVDSLKLAVLMWLMTYVGAVFNGLTLLILAGLFTFSAPVVYEKYQSQIDHYVDLVRKQVSCALGKIQEKLPGTKRKSE